MGDFSDRVFEVVRRIPRGKVATYGQVGRLIGAPRSARYVGYALRANPEPGAEVNSIPCHRVVFKDGGLCKGFAFGGPEVQREMLEAEGVAFADDAHVVAKWYSFITVTARARPRLPSDWRCGPLPQTCACASASS